MLLLFCGNLLFVSRTSCAELCRFNLQQLYWFNDDDEMMVTELAEPVRRDGGRSPEGQLPPRAPRSLIGRGRVEGGAFVQLDWGSENAGTKPMCLLYYLKV